MNERISTTSTYQRLLAIRWEINDSHNDLHLSLMEEYLRRMALWAKALDLPKSPPFFDLAMEVAPDVRADSEMVLGLLKHLKQFPLSLRMIQICEFTLHWSAISETEQAKQFNLPCPYEPLIVMFEHGGSFRTEHGWIDISTGGSFRMGDWRNYADRPPFVKLKR